VAVQGVHASWMPRYSKGGAVRKRNTGQESRMHREQRLKRERKERDRKVPTERPIYVRTGGRAYGKTAGLLSSLLEAAYVVGSGVGRKNELTTLLEEDVKVWRCDT
jgi:hypothetical protein